MISKEQEQQKNKEKIASEVIYSEKATEIFNHIQKIKEKINNLTNLEGKDIKKINFSEFLEFINGFGGEMDYLGEELMRQDIRVATATGLIEKLPYPTCCEVERQRLREVNEEIENRISSKNFPH